MADLNKILIGEYLESLTERDELDYIFPILLEMMDYQILSRPGDSKGQPQHGRDVVAIREVDGVNTRFYFEIKGGADRNITDNVLSKQDGVIESLRASKYTPYVDRTISGFETWPAKYILVHNGTMSENTKATYNGFINSEFEEGETDRWDISRLAEMFSDKLFNEYILTDKDGTVSLFKKTLALLDVPEYDLNHFFTLVEKLSVVQRPDNDRYRKKFITSLGLIAIIIHQYCKEVGNLDRSLKCIDYIILKAWHWILQHNLETTRIIKEGFVKLLSTQLFIYNAYFEKTIAIARLPNGLFTENGGMFEEIGYSIRTTEYLSHLIYYIRLINSLEGNSTQPEQVSVLVDVIQSNSNGSMRPLLDNQSVSYLNVAIFLLENNEVISTHEFLKGWLKRLLDEICLIKTIRHRLPELHSNVEALIEFVAKNERPYNYNDASSTLILILLELIACVNAGEHYELYRKQFIKWEVDNQTYYPTVDGNTELRLFEKTLFAEGYCEVSIELPESFEDFKTKIKAKQNPKINYRTDAAGFYIVRHLAHIYYKTPFFPDEWRKFIFKNHPPPDHNEKPLP